VDRSVEIMRDGSQSLDTAPTLEGLIGRQPGTAPGRLWGCGGEPGPARAGIAVPACPFTTMSKR
jgi:hypothetical protein